jgi:hypothetical protein
MRAIDLVGDYKDQKFKLAKGRVIWESISWRGNSCYISRVVEGDKGKPFLLGLNYIGRYIDPETELIPVDCCPYCFDPDCTSDHK